MSTSFLYLLRERQEISVRYDTQTSAIWCYFNPKVRPCYSYEMLKEIHTLQLEIIDYFKKSHMKPEVPIRFFILASQTSSIYNYGGDLNLFEQMIKKQDRNTLFKYGQLGTEIIYLNSVNFNLPITTIALVEGTALGGGFEAVLSCSISIAEEQTKMGLPEIRFNLFPGMGAYSLLARALGVKRAEEIIVSGKVYHAKELYEMGLLTIITKEGKAQERVVKFMKKHNKLHNGMQAIAGARNRFLQIEREELMEINKIWVDAALKLEEKDLKVMHKLIEAQNQKHDCIRKKIRTRQDRRIDLSTRQISANAILLDRREGIDRRHIKVS